ncbi:MAG: HigA family addiction module antitoxin [Bacteroidota bacterium]
MPTTATPQSSPFTFAPVHPGEILAQEFMEPLGLSGVALAEAIGVPRNRIYAIVGGKRAITGDTALRLSRFFGNSAPFWMNLQQHYDLETAREAVGEKILAQIQPVEYP